MNTKKKSPLLISLFILNMAALIFYYSPLSLYGYWIDTIFFLAVIITSWFLAQNISTLFTKRILKIFLISNFVLLLFNSISFFHFITPVHAIPKGFLYEKEIYGYFIERGNQGLTNGCYGEIQYHKTIPFLPILEYKIDVDKCSALDFKSVMKGK